MGKTKEQTGAIRYVVGRGRSKTLRIATKDDPEIIYGWLREVCIDAPYEKERKSKCDAPDAGEK